MILVPVKLDKERNLGFGMRAISIIERKFKKKIGEIDFEDLYIEEIAEVIAAGFKHEDDKMTADTVMTLIDKYGDLNIIIEAVSQAMGGEQGEKN